MMLIDNRAGSVDLFSPLAEMGVPVDLTTLPFGDLAFTGRGDRGADVWIGIEHKRVTDFIRSMATRRLPGHQLPGLVQEYDRAYLVVEGAWTHDGTGRVVGPGPDGQWMPFKGCPPAFEFEQQFITLETRGGVRLRLTPDRRASLRFIAALYRWWTHHDLDQHRAHLAVHAPDMDQSLLTPISDFRRALMMLLPGIGLSASRSVEAHFAGSLRRMIAASETEWAALELTTERGAVKRLGKTRAKRIHAVLAT